MTNRISYILVYLLSSIFLLTSCDKKQASIDNPFDFVQYVNAFGPKSPSKLDQIFIDLKKLVVKDLRSTDLNSLLSITPSVEGEVFLEDNHLLIFRPTYKLRSGTNYLVTAHLDKIVKDPKNLTDKTFTFSLKTIPQSASISINDLFTREEIWNLKANIVLADKEKQELIEEALVVRQDGEVLDFSLKTLSPTSYEVFVSELDMSKADSKVIMTLNSSQLDMSENMSNSIDLPDPNIFTLVKSLQEEGKVTFIFSQILDKNQNLNGLIKSNVDGESPQYALDGNKLVVFTPNSSSNTDISIEISDKLKSTKGLPLQNSLTHRVVIQDIIPTLKNVGIGHIIPGSEKVIFPFEAKGLKNVQLEIFKVYADNAQQFYQKNTTSSYYNLEYVGEKVHSEVLSLRKISQNYDPSVLQRYFFDLKKFVEKESNALYEVRLGFLPSDVTTPCASALEYNIESLPESVFEDNYYGIFGYYADFEWNHRDNPCKLAFYGQKHFIAKMIVSTNIGIIAKKANNGDLVVIANDISSSLPIGGASVTIYNKAQRQIFNSKTDSEGMFKAFDAEDAYMIKISKGKDENWIRVQENDGLSTSKFDVGGRSKKAGLDGYLYGERNIWRPGDTIYLDFMLFDSDGKLPQGHPVKISLQNPQGKSVFSETSTYHSGPIYPFIIPTRSDFITGNYTATAYVGTSTFSKLIKIENIKPNKFSINSSLENEVLDATNSQLTTKGIPVEYDIQWLYGAPAKDKRLTVEMDLKATSVNFKTYDDFRFEDPRNQWYPDETKVIADTRTKDDGKATIQLKLDSELKPAGKLNIQFKNTAYENSGDFSVDAYTVPFSPYTSYVGVRLPQDDYNYQRVSKGNEATLEFVALRSNGQGEADANLDVQVYKMENYWWYNSYNNDFDMTNMKSHVSTDKFTVKTASDGKAQQSVQFNTNGRYYINVCNRESGHCTGDYLYVGYAWDDGEMSDAEYEEASQLNISLSKKSYTVGEDVELIVPSYFNGRALVSLENGDKIIESFWTTVLPGNNRITFTPQLEMFPTVYAHVTLLQEHSQKANDMPIRLYGVIPVKIDDESLLLKPEIIAPEKVKPNDEYEITVKESSGFPMHYTLAIVDEGLLNISRFKTPDPFNHFYTKPSLGVRTYDNYNDVLSAFGEEQTSLFSIGGDMENVDVAEDVKANRFRAVVEHVGPFFLGSGAQKSHKITMPNYIGSVRVMVVAADGKSFGSNQKQMLVNQDLMVMATLPRSLATGDKFDVPLTIFSMKDGLGKVEYGATSSSSLVRFEQTSGEMNSLVADEKIERIGSVASNSEGVAKLGFFASTPDMTSTQEIEIDVRNPNPIVRRSVKRTLMPGEELLEPITPIGKSGGTVSFTASTFAPINVNSQIDMLMRYPYGCLEQRVSAGIAALYQAQLTELNIVEKENAKTVINDLLKDLYRFESQSGYSLWPSYQYANEWLTSYVGEFLFLARDKGYNVNSSAINYWISSQKSATSNWSPSESQLKINGSAMLFSQAYRLYTQAQIGKPMLSEMNRMREDYALDLHSNLMLAAAYQLAGRGDIAKELVGKEFSTANTESYVNFHSFGSDIRNSALRIILFDHLNEVEKLEDEVLYFNNVLAENTYLSTQSAAFVLRALALVSDRFGSSNNINVTSSFSGTSPTTLTSATGLITVNSDVQSDTELTVKNNGNETIFLEITRIGKEEIGKEKTNSSKLTLSTQYVDMAGEKIDPTSIQQGTDVRIITTITRTTDQVKAYENLALRQILPAGWEITNNRVFDFGSGASTGIDYQDFLDNQVNSFFKLTKRKSITIELLAKATYTGSFYHPKIICESMYENDIYAEQKGFISNVRL